MAKERLHITVSEETLKFARTQLPYFNDSISAYVGYCISLHKQILTNQVLQATPMPLQQSMQQPMQQPMLSTNTQIENPIQQEEKIDEDTMASIKNILNL